jgi:hypothetical protein
MEHYQKFDEQLQTELSKTLKSFDWALVTVYTNFVDELKKLNNQK